ncbi:ABC transporter ATP-binding protein [Bacillus daqingensis]|uniref:ABC transporter ATP-binding protein n=1 Tax=Bacillus daqingensis TaxID=872396 RepID=A0ABV9NT93_9BACI
MRDSFSKLAFILDQRAKKKMALLLLLMVGAAVLETVGVGLMLPFVTIITDPQIIESNSILNNLYETLGFTAHSQFIIAASIALVSVFMLKNLYLTGYNYVQFRIILNQQVNISQKLLRSYLEKPYQFHIDKNSSELLRNINSEVPKLFQGVVLASMQLITELMVIFFILCLLLYTSSAATITAGAVLGLSIFTFFKVFRNKIGSLGIENQHVFGNMIKAVNESLGAAKMIKLMGKETHFVNRFTGFSQRNAKNDTYLKMLENTPRFFIETLLVITIIITMLLLIAQGVSTSELIATMALFAMAAFRLMPSITRVMALTTQIRYNRPALNVVAHDLTMLHSDADFVAKKEIKPFSLTGAIDVQNITFSYPEQSTPALKNVSLTIPARSSIALIGHSGSGKSTLMDCLLGLLEPNSGKIMVDGNDINKNKQAWQTSIGYIPQTIYLMDDTITNNIALGETDSPEVKRKAMLALNKARLLDFVNALPNGMETNIGEGGAKLSGGQRQRLGIARALYHDPDIIFMDEATSALDNQTEAEIMQSINELKLEKTIIIIAHRLSTIEQCDEVYKLNNGVLESINNSAGTG